MTKDSQSLRLIQVLKDAGIDNVIFHDQLLKLLEKPEKSPFDVTDFESGLFRIYAERLCLLLSPE